MTSPRAPRSTVSLASCITTPSPRWSAPETAGSPRAGNASACQSAVAVYARGQRDADRREADLRDQFEPVESRCVGITSRPGDGRADERGHDADQHGQPDRDGLLTGYDQTSQCADDQADDDRRDDAGDGHRISLVATGPWSTAW